MKFLPQISWAAVLQAVVLAFLQKYGAVTIEDLYQLLSGLGLVIGAGGLYASQSPVKKG